MTTARLLRIWRQRARSVFRKSAIDDEVARELAFHYEQLLEEYVAEGLTPADARNAARRSLGNTAVLEEQCRDERRVTWLHDIRQDVAYGLRLLARTAGLTAIAVVSLALGIGANAVTLALIHTVFAGALAFPNADRLVVIRGFASERPFQTDPLALGEYIALVDGNRSFNAMGVSLGDQRDFGADDSGAPLERVSGQLFEPSVFTTLGMAPALGRVFTTADAQADARHPVIVISYDLWQRRFAGTPDILDRPVRLNGRTTSIIGVMPAAFRYPNDRSEYFAPLVVNRATPGPARFFGVVARLQDGASIPQVAADVAAVASGLARDFPDRNRNRGLRTVPLRQVFFGWSARPLATLQAGVLLVFAIACANVAGLLLARGLARGQEMAIRRALGAGRGRLLKQLLTESMLLAAIAGALAIFVAWWGLRFVRLMNPLPTSLPLPAVPLTGSPLLLIVMLSIAAALLFGLAPALAVSRPDALGSFSVVDRLQRAWWRLHGAGGIVVSVQIALALVLLVGAALLVNSFVRIAWRDLNIDPSGLLTFQFRLPPASFLHSVEPYRGRPLFEINPLPSQTVAQVYERLRKLPGVDAVAGVSHTPAGSILVPRLGISIDRELDSSDVRTGDDLATAVCFLVTPNVFTTLKAPLVHGRELNDRDIAASPWAAVVNETMARRFWPGQNPIGRHFTVDGPGEQPREVVGVVRDIPLGLTQAEGEPVFYASFLQQPSRYPGPWAPMLGQMTFLMRSASSPRVLVPAVRRAVAEVDPNRPISDVFLLDALFERVLWERHAYVLALGVFAVMSTLLAAIGIYGVMAYSVARRTREIGLRRALGATGRDVIGLVGRRAVMLFAVGVAAGLAGALAATRFIASQLYGVTPTDPVTFGAVVLLFGVVAASACIVPIRRALRVDPTVALKYE
jgi:putative ABC transport system permease protein